jgi:hypothetical protein
MQQSLGKPTITYMCCHLPATVCMVGSTLKQASKVPASQQSQHVSGGCVLTSLGVYQWVHSLGQTQFGPKLNRACCRQTTLVRPKLGCKA